MQVKWIRYIWSLDIFENSIISKLTSKQRILIATEHNTNIPVLSFEITECSLAYLSNRRKIYNGLKST